MNVHISYKVHKTPDIEKEINHHIEKLRKRLQVFRPELVHLKGSVEQNSPREGTIVSLNLRLPSGQMAVQQSGSTATAVVKAAFDDLVLQITKHKDILRSSHKWRRRRTSNASSEPGVPFEQTLASVQPQTISPDDVRSYVNANLARLERFVERELYLRQSSDQLPPDSVTREEVVDEAIARALADGDKPERLALEPWLYHLAIRAINDLAVNSREVSSPVHLEQSARKQNVRASDEPELQFHQPDETLMAESVIADTRTATPEQVAYSDEMITLVQSALNGTQRPDRDAFILYAIEGFSVAEISAIVERKPEEVRASISAVREHVRKAPSIANQFRDKLLQKTSTA